MVENYTFTSEAIVGQEFVFYQKNGHNDYIGEPMSQLAQLWQAVTLAGADDEVVLAAFSHNLGYLCAAYDMPSIGGLGAVNHRKLGPPRGFSARVVWLRQSHVQANRYLTHKHPSYLRQPLVASRATLDFQGKVMSAEEAAAFEQNPEADAMLQLRPWDGRAKEAYQPVGNFDPLKVLAFGHLQCQRP